MKRFAVPMPLCRALVDAHGDPVRVEPLRYVCEAAPSAQARFRGRLVLRPLLDLGAFRVRAVIDWLDLRVETRKVTQTRHVSDLLAATLGRRPHVSDAAGQTHKTDTSFTVRLQDPDPEMVGRMLAALEARWGLVGAPVVVGIEVAVDWYPPGADDVLRLQMVALLQRHVFPTGRLVRTARDEPRCFSEAGGVERTSRYLGPVQGRHRSRVCYNGVKVALGAEAWRTLEHEMHNTPFVDGTVYVGAREADALLRIQNKVTDTRHGGCFRMLEPEGRRARIEVALRGLALEELGLTRLEALGGLECLRKAFFDFWLPTVNGRLGLHVLDVQAFRRTGVYGLEAYQDARWERRKAWRRGVKAGGGELARGRLDPRRRTVNGTRLAFAVMNRRCDDALRRLGRAWRRKVEGNAEEMG